MVALVAAFVCGIVLNRDRVARQGDILDSKPISSLSYVAGKYLGSVLPVVLALLGKGFLVVVVTAVYAWTLACNRPALALRH